MIKKIKVKFVNKGNSIIPVKKYKNIVDNKFPIYKDNKGKSGVYRLNNMITGESYIGSSANLGCRLRYYFSDRFLKREILRSNSLMCRALVKDGLSKFSLKILCYCDCDKTSIVNKEQFYIDLLEPEFNIYRKASSSLSCVIK